MSSLPIIAGVVAVGATVGLLYINRDKINWSCEPRPRPCDDGCKELNNNKKDDDY